MIGLHAQGTTLPLAWEQAVLALWAHGDKVKTEYDKPGDPPSRDAFMTIEVLRPLREPRIHMCMPGGYHDLEKYVCEVLFGVHDHWIDSQNPNKWQYTYFSRLFNYFCLMPDPLNKEKYLLVNQIEIAIQKLKKCPHTRRAQAITWQPWVDNEIKDPPCLQRLWFRVYNGRLCMTAHIRSNDAYKAAFMNMFAFTEVQRYVAQRLGIPVGSYIHVADSFHIYGSYFEQFQMGFLKSLKEREFKNRVVTTESCIPYFLEGIKELILEKDMPAVKKKQLEERASAWAQIG